MGIKRERTKKTPCIHIHIYICFYFDVTTKNGVTQEGAICISSGSEIESDHEQNPLQNLIQTLKVISIANGHCILHTILCCMQHENVKAIPSKDKLLDSVRFDILNHLDFYCNFINSLDRDCVDELESYISNSSKRYDSDTIDLIIAALSNLLKCRILLLQEKSDVYALEHPHHCINPGMVGNTPSFDFKFLWNGRDHYDSLVSKHFVIPILLGSNTYTFPNQQVHLHVRYVKTYFWY